jgi:hypothetical protein
MNKLSIATAIVLFSVAAGSAEAKEKYKRKDYDGDRRDYSERHRRDYGDRDRRDYHSERDRRDYSDRDRRSYGDRDYTRYRESSRERSRTIYVIERDRPVQRVVYVDSDGRYFQRVSGRRVYVRQRYFDSYPSRYYTSSGKRRINITLPF